MALLLALILVFSISMRLFILGAFSPSCISSFVGSTLSRESCFAEFASFASGRLIWILVRLVTTGASSALKILIIGPVWIVTFLSGVNDINVDADFWTEFRTGPTGELFRWFVHFESNALHIGLEFRVLGLADRLPCSKSQLGVITTESCAWRRLCLSASFAVCKRLSASFITWLTSTTTLSFAGFFFARNLACLEFWFETINCWAKKA